MALYLCEKPSQASDIARVLGAAKKSSGFYEGNGHTVTWCQGHLVEQAEPGAYGEQYQSPWRLECLPILPDRWKIEVKAKTRSQYAVVKSLVSNAEHIVIATDADREGEVIAREILDMLRFNKRVSRLWTSALDDSSLRTAIASLKDGKSTEALYHAGLARSRADWLVGMNLTRAYSCKASGSGTLSIGRVQTVTLYLVVRRDLEIENFKPRDYFEVVANFKSSKGIYSARWLPPSEQIAGSDDEGESNENESKAWPKCWDRSMAEKVVSATTGVIGKISKAETKRKQQDAPLPFDMSSLQAYASAKWGYSLKTTLDTAQSLYATHKVTSYPRVECRYLPSSQFADAKRIMSAIEAADKNLMQLVSKADLTRVSLAWNDKAIEAGAEAHHGIIPTTVVADYSKMSHEERNIYDVICKHYIAQFYPPYSYDSSTIDTVVSGHLFRCAGVMPIIYGWKNIFGDDLQDVNTPTLPPVQMGDSALCQDAKINGKKTTPPPRYTQGTLADDMKNIHRLVDDPAAKAMLKKTRGIGTPATRDAIIENLFHKLFIEGKKQIISTTKGRELIKIVSELTPDLIDPITTAKWELVFDRIASGAVSEGQFTGTIKAWITRMVDDIKRAPGVDMSATAPGPSCPLCNGQTVSRKGRNGVFWGCKGYPECKGIASSNSEKKTTKRKFSTTKKRVSNA